MAGTGMDRTTGRRLTGWPHVQQSIGVIVSTAFKSRVMRRGFGGDIPRLVDAPMSPVTLIDFFATAAKAIKDNEPRFAVRRFSVDSSTSDGALGITATGTYYPRGHLGDFSVAYPQSASVTL